MSEDLINEKLLEKLRACYTSNGNSGFVLKDNLETLRGVTARLYSRAASHDKQIREKTLHQIRRKKDNTFQLLLSLLELVDDQATGASIAGIIYECISPKSGLARTNVTRYLIEINATQVTIKLLVRLYVREVHPSDPFLHELIKILSQLSQRDMKFINKIRQLSAVSAVHHYLKIFHQYGNKLMIPLLVMMKTMAKNGTLLPLLIKDGISVTMEKILFTSNLAPTNRFKLLLSIVSNLSKNVQFCTKMIKAGIVPVLLKVFARWEKYDGKNRLKICHDTIVTLQHVCSTKPGRSALRKESGFTPLYKFCLLCPEDKVYDRLLAKVCSVINVCLQKRELPIPSLDSPLQFTLPINIKKGNDDDQYPESDSDGDDGDEGSDDVDNEKIDTDVEYDENDANVPKISSAPAPFDGASRTSDSSFPDVIQRDVNDLYEYRRFFTEYFYQLLHNGSVEFDEESSNQRTKGKDIENDATAHSYNCSISGIDALKDQSLLNMTQRSSYCKLASDVRSVQSFVKVAYPDMMGGNGIGMLQPFYTKDRKVCRSKLITCIEHTIHKDRIYNNIVYDLDKLLSKSSNTADILKKLCNNDETRIGLKESNTSALMFESRFESGNLRKAIQVGAREYDLILTPDVNSAKHSQWFYFEVSNMDNVSPYVFNIINCEKSNSQFNQGMKPLLYSVKEATLGRPGWFRIGTDICYYRNSYKMPGGNDNSKQTFLTATFTIKFLHNLDVCYIAYTFPYTYTNLMHKLKNWMVKCDPSHMLFHVDGLCKSLNGNVVPLVTVTAPDTQQNRIMDREIVFLTSRVHPGEGNASWVMDGCISYLLSSSSAAIKLRNQYVFKIIPMLNVEGVINGCHRCGLTNEDLNRRWDNPNPAIHPSIYHAKGLLEYCTKILMKRPYIFCDFHGHSRRKNAFFFGCSNQESWLEADRMIPNVGIEYLLLPHLMENCCIAFCSNLCNYKVERSREPTARVTVWREFGVHKSYTVETSYCGCDQGPYKGYHLDTIHLQEIGSNFCLAIACLFEENKLRMEFAATKQEQTNVQVYAGTAPGNSSSSFSSTDFAEDTDNSKETYSSPCAD